MASRTVTMGLPLRIAIVGTLALLSAPVHAADADLGGYLRVGVRPDFGGGSGALGYWNLFGRLLNEGPWLALDGRIRLLERVPGSDDVWTHVHVRIEGGSLANADPNGGSLTAMRLSLANSRQTNSQRW